MVLLSQVLLAGLTVYVFWLLAVMYLAYRWQFTRGGQEMPWYLAGGEPLVGDCKGYKDDGGWLGDAVWDMIYRAMDSDEDEKWATFMHRVVTKHASESVKAEIDAGRSGKALLGLWYVRQQLGAARIHRYATMAASKAAELGHAAADAAGDLADVAGDAAGAAAAKAGELGHVAGDAAGAAAGAAKKTVAGAAAIGHEVE